MSAEERNRDQRIVDAVLLEEGLADDAALSAVLLEVRGLANSAAPVMSPELEAALSAAQALEADRDAIVTSLDSRRGKRRRALIVGAAVIATMGLGVGAAAASSEGFRQAAQNTFSSVVDVLNPGGATQLDPELPVPGQTGGAGNSGEPTAPPSTTSPTTIPGQLPMSPGLLPAVPDVLPATPGSEVLPGILATPAPVVPVPSTAPAELPLPLGFPLPNVTNPLDR